jgi:hypothetical protein
VRILILIVLAAAIAGCGSSSGSDQASAPVAPVQETTTSEAKARLTPPCSPRARAALARAAGASSVEVSPFTAASSAAACRLHVAAGGLTVITQLDSAPQAYTRLERKVVEYGQNVLHSGQQTYPRTIKRLGLDADWFAAENRLLTTDGVRLIDVKVRWPSASPARRQALATRLARVYLGPLRDPYG